MNILLLFFLGAVAGSFANVVIYRVPKGASVVRPESSCTSCGRRLTVMENIPIISYFWLKGRCKGCGRPISRRYPLVELVVAGLWVLTGLRFGWVPQLPAFLIFATALVILAAIDLETRRLPNKVLGPGALLALVLLAGAAAAKGDPSVLKGAGLGALAYGVPMLALALAVPAGMGMGDVKFAGYLGLHLGSLGLLHVAVGAFAGFFFGAFAGICLMALGKKGRKETVPFGPAMAAGAGVAVFWGSPLLELWLG